MLIARWDLGKLNRHMQRTNPKLTSWHVVNNKGKTCCGYSVANQPGLQMQVVNLTTEILCINCKRWIEEPK